MCMGITEMRFKKKKDVYRCIHLEEQHRTDLVQIILKLDVD